MNAADGMNTGPGLLEAVAVAQRAHDGQLDKHGLPYVAHCMRMAEGFPDERHQVVALLHDVVEKGRGWNLERLRMLGFDAGILAAVDAMTRREGEAEDDFVRRALRNPLACTVKLADLRDNFRQALQTRRNPAKYRRGLELAEQYLGCAGSAGR